MLIYDVMRRHDGIIKAYLRGDITETIIKMLARSLSSITILSFSCNMKILPFICLLSVIKGETVDQRDLSCDEHFWENTFQLKFSRLQQLYFDEHDYLPSRHSRIRNLFRAMFLLYIGLRSYEFM